MYEFIRSYSRKNYNFKLLPKILKVISVFNIFVCDLFIVKITFWRALIKEDYIKNLNGTSLVKYLIRCIQIKVLIIHTYFKFKNY